MDDRAERLAAALGDRYAIDREAGSGGMAIVYLARDRKLQRSVAIKVLRPELANSVAAERFLREIQIAAKLQHPNILSLHDCGEADGLLYYVMPYMEGETLKRRLERQKQLTIPEALALIANIASAADYAHSRGIVHRDLKPENILLSEGRAYVADFGIARAITTAGGERLTDTGITVGTPTYMSPEQARGSLELDGRSDVYSLGVLLYEMLAGTPPFTGPTPQVITQRHTKDPPLPVRTVRPDVPEVMEGALFRALAKSPSERFSTAGEFSAALRGEVGAIDPASLSFSGPIPKPSFWSELKRRHVYHVGAGYIFLFFALLQIVDVVFPALNFADWADTLVVVVGLAGFPIALLLAWIYELTPRGIQRTQAIKTQPDGDA